MLDEEGRWDGYQRAIEYVLRNELHGYFNGREVTHHLERFLELLDGGSHFFRCGNGVKLGQHAFIAGHDVSVVHEPEIDVVRDGYKQRGEQVHEDDEHEGS
jgi:hypothetical protein